MYQAGIGFKGKRIYIGLYRRLKVMNGKLYGRSKILYIEYFIKKESMSYQKKKGLNIFMLKPYY